MDLRHNPPIAPTFARELEAVLDWWRDAGLSHEFSDTANAWLAEPEAPRDESGRTERKAPPPPPPRAPLAPASAPRVRLDLAALPAQLADFAPWWLSAPELDGGRTVGRVAPRGVAGADLMVLVEEPDPDDGERLLSGGQGRMLDLVLGAMGIASDTVYLASALPRATPAADWADAQATGLGEVLRHHVALVAPKRLISFGFNILPLLGHDLPHRPAVLAEFQHEGRTLPMLAARSLASLFNRPAWKAQMWRVWLDGSRKDPSGD